MGTSPSGVLTLLFLIFIGPIIYLGRHFFLKSSETTVASDSEEPSTEKREEISSSAYTFSLIGYAIGIGNIWRFPYVISQNGGAAAVVAYLVCAVFVAVPLFLYESILGQYTRCSSATTWTKINPRYLSFGLAQCFLVFLANTYFSMVIAYTLPYIVSSCQDPFPWVEKGSGDYWRNTILNKYEDLSDSPSGAGPIQWHLALSLLFLWVAIFLAVAFGKKLLAKITYVTVTMPVVLMLILVFRTAALPGAGDGISFYIGKFEGSKLRDLDVWATALSQILFSLSPGFGTAITFSSFTKPKEDVFKVCMIVAVANSAFSLIGGFAVFAMVGNLAWEEGVSVEEMASSGGTGLAFIVIASAMESFGRLKNVMAVLFFVMLLTLGFDSAVAWCETVISIVEDLMDAKKFKKLAVWKTSLAICLVSYVLGLVYATRKGNEILDVVDHYVGIVFLLIVCFIEALILNFEFGWRRLALSLKSATIGLKGLPEGRTIFPTYLCRFDFHIAVPVMTAGLALRTFVKDIQDPYGGYPNSILIWGWVLLGICIGSVFLTLWKQEEGLLPPIEEDPKFAEVLEESTAKPELDHEQGVSTEA